MRLVEFLIHLLEAHAETLKRLAALLGEERLLELLDEAGEHGHEAEEKIVALHSELEPPKSGSGGSAYQELEGAVRELHLPAVLEFYVWAYPHYRAFIESPLDLNSRIPGTGGETGSMLVEEAVTQNQAWVRKLPIPPQISEQVERTAYVPWLRFRTTVLKKIGKRPMGTV